MVVDDDGGLEIHVREQPAHTNGSTRLFVLLAIIALFGMIIACTAFTVAMLILRSEQRSAAAEFQQATEERRRMSAELERIRETADRALGETECRSLAFSQQNAVEADADVIALELLTEVVSQSARSAAGEPINFTQLSRLEREARTFIDAERVANAAYREALGKCTANPND